METPSLNWYLRKSSCPAYGKKNLFCSVLLFSKGSLLSFDLQPSKKPPVLGFPEKFRNSGTPYMV